TERTDGLGAEDTHAARRKSNQDALRFGRRLRTHLGGSRAVVRSHARTHSPDRGQSTPQAAASFAFAKVAGVSRRLFPGIPLVSHREFSITRVQRLRCAEPGRTMESSNLRNRGISQNNS